MNRRPESLLEPLGPERRVFLRDESRFEGRADFFAAPSDLDELVAAVQACLKRGLPLTPQGARTGLCGAGVPQGGCLLSLAALNRPWALSEGPDGSLELEVQPGLSLDDLNRDLLRRKLDLAGPPPRPDAAEAFRRGSYFWPPDPGEGAAALGGLFAVNARGPAALRHGSTAAHVRGVKLITADGQLRELRRGRRVFQGARLELPAGGFLELSPRSLGLEPQADLLDALAGGQGMHGVIASLTLALTPRPAAVWALAFFFEREAAAAEFIEAVLAEPPEPLASLDFLDEVSLAQALELKKTASKLRDTPDPPSGSQAAAFVELQADGQEQAEEAAAELMARVEAVGGDPDRSWALTDDETGKMKMFRHAVPEALGCRLDRLKAAGRPGVKLAFDAQAPGRPFGATLAELRAELADSRLTAAVFGHAAGNHLHVNILADDPDQRRRGLELAAVRLERAKASGGELFLEHGVGKIKRELFLACERPERVEALKAFKRAFDPQGWLNPGNVFPDGPLGEEDGS
ncbi:MAG: FAD-binding oxidoreductase [Deltaproteobacteria bacterium]|jgi:D-lactate dehydrogenase (cytochrome)|nr:FAD-binding oxidoreductase [Deltaproteobacteria bacterium]